MTQEVNAYHVFTRNGKYLRSFIAPNSKSPLKDAKQLAWCYAGYVVHNGLVIVDYSKVVGFER